MTDPELKDAIAKYRWYHRIQVRPGIFTTPANDYHGIWDFITPELEKIDLHGKSVLDIGCRDGLFSFQAERQGASRVLGIDNNLSRGAVDLLIPEFKSKVLMTEDNLYGFVMAFPNFDVVMFFGVLYHLRYPFLGLRCATKALKIGGVLLIETAVLVDQGPLPLVYCPFRSSPYEPTSVSFFNISALREVLGSMGLTLEDYVESDQETVGESSVRVRRGWLRCQKREEMEHAYDLYWNATHHSHS